MRPPRTPLEPRGNARVRLGQGAVVARSNARERVLEQADVPLGRSHEHGHLVERHAAPRLLENAPRDLHRLAPFARRGEEPHVAGPFARRRPRAGEQVPPQRDEVALPFLLEDFANQTQALQPFQCLEISERDGDDDGGGGLEESPDELKLDRGVERHVEQDERALARPCHGRRGGCHQRGAIDRRRGRELFVEPLEERGQVRSAERQRGQRRRGDPRDQDFLTRVRVGSHERARFRQAQLGRGGFDGATVGEGDGEAPSRTPCRGAGIGRATRPTNSQLQTANSELRTHNSQLTTSNFKLQTANSKLNARRAGAPPTL